MENYHTAIQYLQAGFSHKSGAEQSAYYNQAALVYALLHLSENIVMMTEALRDHTKK